MNKDAPVKDLQAGEYRHAENLIAVNEGVGKGVRLENVLGTKEISLAKPSSINTPRCVGLWNYKEENKVYGFYEGSYIMEYDGKTGTSSVLMNSTAPNILAFDRNYPVHNVFVVEGLLYFNDSKNGLRKINIEYARTGALDNYTDERFLSVIKAPPLRAPTHSKITDTTQTDTRPPIRELPVQFASRYVYNDNEISVLSPISKVSPALDWDYDVNSYNAISVAVYMDNSLKPMVKRVELLARIGNDGNWAVYERMKPETFTTASSDGFYYAPRVQFDYSKVGALIGEDEFGTSFESVPRLSSASTMIEDRHFVSSSLENYDLDFTDINLEVDMEEVTDAWTELNNAVYFPKYFKENSTYSVGVVFMDKYGRKSAPEYDSGVVSLKIPDTFTENQFDNITGWNDTDGVTRFVVRDIPSAYRLKPTLTGTPPIWASKYQFCVTENQTYNSWFKGKFLVRPLFSPYYKGETEPSAELQQAGVYLENGYWYSDAGAWMERYRVNPSAADLEYVLTAREWVLVDIVIDDNVPIPIDENTVVKLAFLDHVKSGYTGKIQKEYNIISLEDNRIRIKGLTWLDVYGWFVGSFELNGGAHTGAKQGAKSPVPTREELYMHFEFLNKKQTEESPLFYETGEVYPVSNAGTASRAFQATHDYLEGDCYYTGYNTNYYNDGGDVRANRESHCVAYCSKSPIVEPYRVAQPIIKEEVDREAPVLVTLGKRDKTAIATDIGLYNRAKSNSKGRPTIALTDQRELNRGNVIRYSRTFIQDSNVNGLSNFPEANSYPLSSDRGDIVKLIPTHDNILVAIHKRCITTLYIKRAFITTGEGEEILSKSNNIIGDDRRMQNDYGSEYPESIVSHDNIIYGFDGIMSEPWRRSQDGITPLAKTYNMKTYFEEKAQKLLEIKNIDENAVINIIGGYDPWLDMYILTFSEVTYINGSGNTITIPAETIGFSEKMKRWVSFYSYSPEYYSTIMNNLFSSKENSLYIHLDGENRNFIHGETFESRVTVSFVDNPDMPKLFQHMMLQTNKNDWRIEMTTQDGKQSSLISSNFTKKDTMFYADILRNENTPSDVLESGQIPRLHGDLMIGEAIDVTLINEDSERIYIDAVYIGYSPMTGHLLSTKK